MLPELFDTVQSSVMLQQEVQYLVVHWYDMAEDLLWAWFWMGRRDEEMDPL